MTNTVSQSFFRSRWKVFGLLVALLAVALSPFGREAARKIKRERAINHIRKNLGDVQRAEPTFAETTFVERLLRVFYGQESFTAAMSVILNPKQASDLDYLSEISEVKTVTIDCSYVSNEALSESWKFVDPIIVTLKSAVVNEELFGDVARHGKLSLAIFEKCTFDSQGMEKLLLCPQVTSLQFNACTLEGSALSKIGNKNSIVSLEFTNCSLTDSDLSALHGAKSTVGLKLDEGSVTDSGLVALHDANKSWSIEIATGQLNMGRAQIFNKYPSHTEIGKVEYLGFHGPKVSNLSLSILKEAVQLQSFTVFDCEITDSGLKELESLNKLEFVRMYGTKIDGTGLKYLPVGLKELELRTKRDCDLAHVGRLKNLEMISIYEAKTTDEDLFAIRGLDQLLAVNFGSMEATEKGILCIPKRASTFTSFSGICDTNMVTLASNFPNLDHLQLGGDLITDATCEALCNAKSLRFVHFHNTAVTEAGKNRLKAAIPECQITGELKKR